jgi:hypothetical protein
MGRRPGVGSGPRGAGSRVARDRDRQHWDGGNVFSRWGWPVFRGLHYLLGFHTIFQDESQRAVVCSPTISTTATACATPGGRPARRPRTRGRSTPKIAELAKRLGVKAKAEHAGARVIVRDRQSVLEEFLASNSVRWSTLQNATSEGPGPGRAPGGRRRAQGSRDLPARAEALDAARRDRLRDARDALKDRSAHLGDRGDPDRPARQLPLLDGRPSRARAGRQDPGDVRGPRKGRRALPVLARCAEGARARAAAQSGDPAPSRRSRLRGPSAGTRVVFHRARLGYYALPPRESQGCLIPVYAFDGTVSTRQLRRYDFVRYVVAARFTPRDLKETGSVFRPFGPVFS